MHLPFLKYTHHKSCNDEFEEVCILGTTCNSSKLTLLDPVALGVVGGEKSFDGEPALDFSIDFEGQAKCEYYYKMILNLSGMIAFFAGFLKGSIHLTVALLAVGLVFAFLTTVPNWSIYNQHSIKWVKDVDLSKSKSLKSVDNSFLGKLKRFLL
ncbi:hypothetical protein HDU92_008058 [Lobulomyces angularis]|nr:hypothetical protein HDU92_008058 [Lobulomyces angularis]